MIRATERGQKSVHPAVVAASAVCVCDQGHRAWSEKYSSFRSDSISSLSVIRATEHGQKSVHPSVVTASAVCVIRATERGQKSVHPAVVAG